MNSQEIQERVYTWACSKDFDAPYGVLTGQHTNPKGRKFLSVTFGRARVLDATVEIFNSKFIILKTSRFGTEIHQSFQDLLDRLETL